jgi:hypothetical protein
MDPKRRAEIEAKIRALLALSAPGSGATEDESILAAEKAAELMEKYNIEELGNIEVEKLDPASYERYDHYHRDPWRRAILYACCKLNFCDMVKSNATVVNKTGTGLKGIWRFTIIGTEINRSVSKMLFEYIEESVKRGAKGAGHAESFKIGASDRIAARIWQMIRDRESPIPTRSGLPAVISHHDSQNNVIKAQLFPNLRDAKPSRQRAKKDDYLAGRKFGDQLALTPVGQTAQNKRLG